MPRTNLATKAPPAAVENSIRQLGCNIRKARLRRNWREQDLADKVGVSRPMIGKIERGTASVAVANYLGALWALGLLDHMTAVADPAHDPEGQALENSRARKQARPTANTQLDDDF